MKRLSLTLSLLLTACMQVFAQYTATTTWPYAYEDFQDGVILMIHGSEKSGQYNVNLVDKKLHFIEGSYVKVANMADLLSVKIGKDIYQNVGGELYKVLAKSDKSLVVEDNEIDFAALNETGGAYGSSSTTLGTTALSSLEGIGGSNSSKNINHMELKLNKENGKSLSFITKKYMFVNGNKIYASKRDFMNAPGLDKEAAKIFLKTQKIKWNNPQDILMAGDFLSDYVK